MRCTRALPPLWVAWILLISSCSNQDAGGTGAGGAAPASSGGAGGAAPGAGGVTTTGGKAGTGGNAATAGAINAGSGGKASPAGGTSSVGGAASGGRNAGGAAVTGGKSAGGAAPANGGESGEGGALDGGGEGGASAGGVAGNEGGESAGGPGGAGAGVDPFGITQLYPTANEKGVWTSEHWDGSAYEIDGRIDDNDPLEISGMRGEGSLEVTGTGELVMSGSQPRIYIYPGANGPWKNVEVTVYYQRVEDEGTAYAGLVVGTRSGAEGHTDSTACDAHTYYARLRNDGAIDFEKELEHPASSTQSRVNAQTVWPGTGQVPYDVWIGWKFVIYNLASGDAVKLEAYRDLTNGEGGGDWVKMNETVDDGGWSVETDCDEYDPSGGEADTVVLDGGVTFIRNTDVSEARYRWVSVREIIAP